MFCETEDTDIVIGFPEVPQHKNSLNLEECRHYLIGGGRIPPTPWAKLYKRTILSDDVFDFPREIDGEEDMIMNIRLFFKIKRSPHFVFKKVYNFRRNPISVSHTKKCTVTHEEAFDLARDKSIPFASAPINKVWTIALCNRLRSCWVSITILPSSKLTWLRV